MHQSTAFSMLTQVSNTNAYSIQNNSQMLTSTSSGSTISPFELTFSNLVEASVRVKESLVKLTRPDTALLSVDDLNN